MNFFPLLISTASLLLTMWIAIAAPPKDGIEARRVLALFVIIALTLILPTGLLTMLVMQISARILAPTTTDISSFVTQIAWSVGVSSAVYPLFWGVNVYPRLPGWISKYVPSRSRAKATKILPSQTKRRK